ncbi:MAG: hypothetical protein WD066_02270 [Planctomycetaceae bacterium]
MARFALRPGWLLCGLILAALAVWGGLFAARIGRQRAARDHVERLGGRVVEIRIAPEWLRERLPEDWLWPFDSIEQVDLSYSRLADVDVPELVARLEPLPDLRSVYLAGTDVGDSSAADLARLTRLRALVLTGTGVTDEGLLRIAPLDRLEWLALGGTGVTDRGLRHLAAFPRLEVLDLDGTEVSDEGIGALASLRHLNELSVANTGVTETALRELGAAMPSLLSVWDD